MTVPYEVGKWLATHVQLDRWEQPNQRPSEGELLMWAGRAAQPIDSIRLAEDGLEIHFKDVGTITVKDDGQSCCENRYLTCDDDLTTFHGARLVHIDLEAAAPPGHKEPEEQEYGDCHEQMFMKVRTTNGDFTVCAHNEHNGYYGGFNAVVMWADA